MANIPIEIIDIIKNLIKEAEQDIIRITKAILFGSYAKGTNNEWSDIDVAFISDDFEGNRLLDNIKLSKSKLRMSIDLETHPFRIEDFSPDNLFVKEILKYGIQII